MLDKNDEVYKDIILKYDLPQGVNLPRCVLEYSDEEIEERIECGKEIFENGEGLSAQDALSIAFCKGRYHDAYYIDTPWMAGRAFFVYMPLCEGEDILSLEEISFGEADVVVTHFLSAACQQVIRHCHAVIVVDTPIRLDTIHIPRRGVKLSIIGTNTEITERYIFGQLASDNYFRGYNVEFSNKDEKKLLKWENPAFRHNHKYDLSFDYGGIYPMLRDTRIRLSAHDRGSVRVEKIENITSIPYPTSSIFIFKDLKKMNGYNFHPVIVVSKDKYKDLLWEMNRTRRMVEKIDFDAWVFSNLRLIIIGSDLDDVLNRRAIAETENNSYEKRDANGSHDIYI